MELQATWKFVLFVMNSNGFHLGWAEEVFSTTLPMEGIMFRPNSYRLCRLHQCVYKNLNQRMNGANVAGKGLVESKVSCAALSAASEQLSKV